LVSVPTTSTEFDCQPFVDTAPEPPIEAASDFKIDVEDHDEKGKHPLTTVSPPTSTTDGSPGSEAACEDSTEQATINNTEFDTGHVAEDDDYDRVTSQKEDEEDDDDVFIYSPSLMSEEIVEEPSVTVSALQHVLAPCVDHHHFVQPTPALVKPTSEDDQASSQKSMSYPPHQPTLSKDETFPYLIPQSKHHSNSDLRLKPLVPETRSEAQTAREVQTLQASTMVFV